MWVKCEECNGKGSVECNSSVGPCHAQCSSCNGKGKICKCGSKISFARSEIPLFDSTSPNIPSKYIVHYLECVNRHNDMKSVLQMGGRFGLYNGIWYSKSNLYSNVFIKEDVNRIVEFAHQIKTIREWLSDPLFLCYVIPPDMYIIIDKDTGLFYHSPTKWCTTPKFFKNTKDITKKIHKHIRVRVIRLHFDFSKYEVIYER